MTVHDIGRSVQPTVPVAIECPECGSIVLIPAGLQLRVRAGASWCHETIDMHTGRVFRRGNE